MTRRSLLSFVISLLLLPFIARADDDLVLLKKAADWQLAALPLQKAYKNDIPSGWIRAPFYTGVIALHRTLKTGPYLDAMLELAEQNHWDLAKRKYPPGGTTVPSSWATTQAAIDAGLLEKGQPFLRHADDLAMGQLYLDLYFLKNDTRMIAPLRKRIDLLMAHPQAGRDDWWWCDSLFMAPATYAGLSVATGQRAYLNQMDKMWWDTTDFLFDKEEHLYFRDRSYFKKKEKNGQKVFWSRGNGWVLAGLVRVLDYMPDEYPNRPKYVALLKEMSERIAGLQQPDGFWRASLLDPESYPGGETSGTAFFCYAMAWGINNSILPRDRYLPVVQNAWSALKSAQQSNGKVGWIQPVGAAPAGLKADDTAQYGVGAFLLAGTEMLKLEAAAAH